MTTGADAGAGRQAAASIKETNEHMTTMIRTTNHDECTRQTTTRSHESNKEPHDDQNEFKATNQNLNSHPAWNQDSRGLLAGGSGR